MKANNRIKRIEFPERFPNISADVVSKIIDANPQSELSVNLEKRTWLMKGKDVDVVYIDCGNGWCKMLYLVPHSNISLEKVFQILSKFEELCLKKESI